MIFRIRLYVLLIMHIRARRPEARARCNNLTLANRIAANGRRPATLRPPIRAKPSYCEDSRAGAMWLSVASECERSETRRPTGFQGLSAGRMLGDVFQVLLIIRFEPEPWMAKAIKLHSWVMARFVHCNFAQIVT